MPDTMQILLILFGTVSLVCIAGFWVLLSRYRRQHQVLEQMKRQVESVSSNLAALCAGAVGVDKRVARLERSGRDLRVWQERVQTHDRDHGENSFGQAIRLVRSGATAGKLVEELGLSRNEADLIVMLHGMKEAS